MREGVEERVKLGVPDRLGVPEALGVTVGLVLIELERVDVAVTVTVQEHVDEAERVGVLGLDAGVDKTILRVPVSDCEAWEKHRPPQKKAWHTPCRQAHDRPMMHAHPWYSQQLRKLPRRLWRFAWAR